MKAAGETVGATDVVKAEKGKGKAKGKKGANNQARSVAKLAQHGWVYCWYLAVCISFSFPWHCRSSPVAVYRQSRGGGGLSEGMPGCHHGLQQLAAESAPTGYELTAMELRDTPRQVLHQQV